MAPARDAAAGERAAFRASPFLPDRDLREERRAVRADRAADPQPPGGAGADARRLGAVSPLRRRLALPLGLLRRGDPVGPCLPDSALGGAGAEIDGALPFLVPGGPGQSGVGRVLRALADLHGRGPHAAREARTPRRTRDRGG